MKVEEECAIKNEMLTPFPSTFAHQELNAFESLTYETIKIFESL